MSNNSMDAMVQATKLNWREIYDEVMEWELSEQEEMYDFFLWDDDNDDWMRLKEHKHSYGKRFRRLRNKTFLPLRRYGNSPDQYEKSHNDSPNKFQKRRHALAIIREQELQEPLQIVQSALIKERKLRKARRALGEHGYFLNWRKTIDTMLAENNKRQHAYWEPETDIWAYSENPYGKNGIEPSWRKIGTYTPATDTILQQQESVKQRMPHVQQAQLVYDWKTGLRALPTPTKPTAKSSRIPVETYGCGGGGIRTLHS